MKILEISDTQLMEELLELVEMANFDEKVTGFTGAIFASTRMGQHGARVKWYPKKPNNVDAPCLTVTVSSEPEASNNGLSPRIAEKASKNVSQWVKLNLDRLIDYWDNGALWDDTQRQAFIKELIPLGDVKRIPPADYLRAVPILTVIAPKVEKIIWYNGAYHLLFGQNPPNVNKLRERFQYLSYYEPIQVHSILNPGVDLGQGALLYEKPKRKKN